MRPVTNRDDPSEASLGVDGLVNDSRAPRQPYYITNSRTGKEISTQPLQLHLAYSVIRQQPMRVAGDIVKDAVKIFAFYQEHSAPTCMNSPGATNCLPLVTLPFAGASGTTAIVQHVQQSRAAGKGG